MSQFFIDRSGGTSGPINTINLEPPIAGNFDITSTGGTVTITDFVGSVNLEVTGSFKWNNVLGTSQAMSSNNGYVCANSGLTTLTLPAVGSTNFGDTIKVIGYGFGGFIIAQNSNNQILFGDLFTTPGASGFIQTDISDTYDSVTLVCIVAGLNAIWSLDGAPQGNYSVN